VAPGTYNAQLNGAPFISGGTVTQPGDYTLVVSARNGLATSTAEVQFTILGDVGGTGDVLIVRILDLGTGSFGAPGDAIVITDSSSTGLAHALIDAGARSGDETYVRTRLTALDVDTLVFMQLTHAHFDHYAGMDELLGSAIHVREFVYNGQVRSAVTYNDVLTEAGASADTVIALAALRTIELGAGDVETTVTMVPPLATYLGADQEDSGHYNEGSIGTLVEHGDFRMFFTGDGEVEANARWRTTYSTLTGGLDILKVGHHGANNAIFDNGFSGSSAWLVHTSPESAVISANGTSHPRINALNELLSEGIDVWCTNSVGEITIRVDEAGVYSITPATAACEAGSEATS
jgi:beta-lactamase superfamily II metal-dependent hydrolase